MNWTEGNLARHARPQQRHGPVARQRQHFARTRVGATLSTAALPPKSFAFLHPPSHLSHLPLPPTSPLQTPTNHNPISSKPCVQVDAYGGGPTTNTEPLSSIHKPSLPMKRHLPLDTTSCLSSIDGRRKRLLLSADWVGVKTSPAAMQHSKDKLAHQSAKGKGLVGGDKQKAAPIISPFFVELKMKSRSPTRPFANIQALIEPRVHIGNQSLGGISTHSATQSCQNSRSSYYSDDNPSSNSFISTTQQDSSDRWSLSAAPRYYVESSPLSIHQPLPQRHPRLHGLSTNTVGSTTEGSLITTLGKNSLSSSSLYSEPDVLDEWKAFLGFPAPKHSFENTLHNPHDEVIYKSVESDDDIQPRQCNNHQPNELLTEASEPGSSIRIGTPMMTDQPEEYILSSDSNSDIISSPTCIWPIDNSRHTVNAERTPESEEPHIVRFSLSSVMHQSGSPKTPRPLVRLTDCDQEMNFKAFRSKPITPEVQDKSGRHEAPVSEDLLRAEPKIDDGEESDTCSEEEWMAFVFGESKCLQDADDILQEARKQASRNLIPSDSMETCAADNGSTEPALSMASCEVISMSIDEVQQLSSLCSSDDNWASSATPLQVHGSPAIIPESSPPVRKGAQHSLKISEGGSQQSRSTVPAGISSDDLSTRAQQGSPKGAKRTTSTSHFSHPKLFVGRLSSVPSAASELLCSMGRTGPIGGSKTGRRRRGINSAKRKKGTDWRPDIRSLPNFEDDPIEE